MLLRQLLPGEMASSSNSKEKHIDDGVQKMHVALEAAKDRVAPFQVPIDVELLMQTGARWITVRPDQNVWLAVADALGRRVGLLTQIVFGNEPVPQSETFESIDIDDGGRLGVDYNDVVRSFVDYCLVLLTVVDSLQTGASCTHRRRRSRR